MRHAIPGPHLVRPTLPLRHAVVAPNPPVRPGPGGTGDAPTSPATGPPDYLALIKGTPAYQSWLSSRNSRLGNLATDRATAIRQLALQFGGLPGGFKDAFGDLTPEDLAASQGNQFSATAQLQRADAQSREAMHRSLAARGMLQSGDLGYGEGQADLALAQGNNDAASQFLAQLNAALSGYAGGAGAVNAEESGLIAQLLPEIMKLYPAPADPGAPGGGGGGSGAPLRKVTGPVRPILRPRMPAPRHVIPGRQP
jgi:hypothetical protein